jgi:NADH:ubiquinone oxidoreductase subunit C
MTFPRWMRELGKVYREQGTAIFVEVPLSRLESSMKKITSHGIRAVNGISGYDSGRDIEVLYHFVHAGLVLTVKTRTPYGKPSVPSVTGLFPSAALFELENHEMLGLDFPGNSSLGSILLSDASPTTPLRRKERLQAPETPLRRPKGTLPKKKAPKSGKEKSS